MKLSLRRKPSTSTLPHRRRLSDGEQAARSGLEQLPQQYTYRRNQTLTGSRTVASASEQSAQRQSPRAVSHSLRQRRRRAGSLLIGMLVAAAVTTGVLYQFIGTSRVTIYGQVRQAANTDTYTLYRQAIDTYLNTYPLQRLRATLNTTQLQQYLEDQGMREVYAVQAPAADGMGKAVFEVRMREPIASWRMNGAQHFVDNNGIIFDRNVYATPSVTITDESGLKAVDIRTATSGRFLSFIGQAVGAFNDLKRPVSQVVLPVDTTRQIIGVLDGYKVKLSVDRPVGEQVEDAVRAVTYLQQQEIQTEYVDVRVSGRAYYR